MKTFQTRRQFPGGSGAGLAGVAAAAYVSSEVSRAAGHGAKSYRFDYALNTGTI